nr:DNA helicase [Tanacetum cinerariifolium]
MAFRNQDWLHKKHAVDEAIESNTGRSIQNNVAAVAPCHLLIEYDDRNMALANANNCGNKNKLFAVEAYKNDNHLHRKQPTDESIQSMTGLPLGNNTATDMDIIDPYNLQTCDILEVINDNNCQQQQQPSKNINDSYYGNTHMLQQPNYARKHRQPFRRPEAKSHNIQHNYLQHQPRMKRRIPTEYIHLGQCTCVCCHWGAMFWECEKVASTSYTSQTGCNKCCYGGRIILRPPLEYPQYVKELYGNTHFMDNIRAYNQMFSMTSVGANVDKSVNKGKGPYVYRISRQIYHWIGSMCPDEGQSPRFLQLYIYDTTNEVKNRLSHFGNEHEPELKEEIVEGLIQLLDNHNALVQLFRTARNKYMDADIPEFKVRLYSVIGTHRYELPTSEIVGAIVFADYSAAENDLDLIIEEYSRFPQRKQDDIRSEYLSGIYDAIVLGDRDGSDIGLRTVLTASFIGSPRYMYAHYLDALVICRVHGSPSFFITCTCNAKWPEIEEHMKPFPLLTTADRADIIDRIFERKVRDYINFVRDSNTFGDVTGVLYTIEFQKRGLPHCHSLLWINAASRVQQDVDVDKYVCAELLNPISDVNAYAVISELMIHGPCGYANPSATCMKDDGHCNRNFPKPYCDKTYIDKDGFVHYRRRDTEIQTQRQNVWLDNRYVVPYNKTLKTFIWKAVTTALRLEEKNVLTVAALGIAALLLPSGRTAHSCFQILLKLQDECIFHIKNSQLADLLRQTDLIIWDEAPMNDCRCFKALDRSLKDICNKPDTSFGSKSIMLGGDFRQTLPVKKKASKLEIIDASITSSDLWPTFKTYTLMQNMRLRDPDETDNEDTCAVQMPTELCILDSDTALATLISFIYDQKTLQTPTPRDLQKKAIVCLKNKNEDMINAQVLNLVNSQQHVYLSLDEEMPHGNDR